MIISGHLRDFIEHARAGNYGQEAQMLVDIIDKLEAENARLYSRLGESLAEAIRRGDVE